MQTARLFSASLVAFALAAASAFCQMAPLPADRHELVTGFAQLLNSPDQRAVAVDLLKRAQQNYNLQESGGAPFVLKASFTSNGQLPYEGYGEMEETWQGANWRWTAWLGGSTQIRVASGGKIYGTTDPVPLRLQMARSAIFWPITGALQRETIRSAAVKYKGKKITCLLLSGGVAAVPASRFWVETEYCIDPSSGLLEMWSEAPGIYVTYDYDDAISFHGHAIARQISVVENGDTLLQIRVNKLEDAGTIDPSIFQPTPEMLAQGPSFTLSAPGRFPIRVQPDPNVLVGSIQPVIVHATIGDNDGQVREAEALQTSDRELADAALEIVRNSTFEPTGMQREAFVNVQFYREERASISVYVGIVRRVVLVERRRAPRPPIRPRGHIPVGHLNEAPGDHF